MNCSFKLAAIATVLFLGACSDSTETTDASSDVVQSVTDAATDTPSTPTDTPSTPADASSDAAADAAAVGGGSCAQMTGTLAYCVDYTGTDVTSEVVRMVCTTQVGTYSATSCPTANRVGRCTLDGATAALTQTATYYAPTTATEAMMACTTAGGMFLPN